MNVTPVIKACAAAGEHGKAAFMDVIPAILEKQVDEAAAAREKAAQTEEAEAASVQPVS